MQRLVKSSHQIEVKNLSVELQRKLEQCTVPENVPFLDLWSVKEALRNTNHTMSRAPGDMPPNLRQEFYQWLAEPYQAILTEIVRTGEWPRQWKLEYGTPIPKESPPLTDEDQLRIISITNKLSMTSEKYILRWIWPFVRSNLDRDQFGGIAQNSVAHYLIEVTNFILYNLDLNIPVPSLMTMVDFSKGFNRIHHGALIEELYRMNVSIYGS